MNFALLLEPAVSLATLGALAASLAALVVFAYLHVGVGAVLCLSVFILGVLVPDGFATVVAGFRVDQVDLLYFMLAVVATLRWLHLLGRRRLRIEHAALLLLAVFLFAGFVRGALVLDPSSAGTEFRSPFYFLAGTAYFASFEPLSKRIGWLLHAWIATAMVICFISVERFAHALGGFDFSLLRVVDSGVTLVLAQAMLMCLYLWLDSKNPKLYRNLALILLPFVVIMQHRTVWVVLVVATVVILLWESRLRNRLLGVIAVGAALTAIGVLAVYGDRGSEVLSESVSDTGTFAWRVEGWSVLLQEQFADRWDVVAGRPMGAGFERFMPSLGYTVNVTPHNYYVELFLLGGAVGVTLLLVIYAATIGRALSRPPGEPGYVASRIGFVLLVSQLVFYITYAPLPEQSIPLGMALSLAWGTARTRPDQRPTAVEPSAYDARQPSGSAI